MSLLQTWYCLSDSEVEDRINKSIPFGYFCGMHMDSVTPDHSTSSRIRTKMTHAKTYQAQFQQINAQFEAHGKIVKTGVIVDARGIEPLLKPKEKTNYKVNQYCLDEEEISQE